MTKPIKPIKPINPIKPYLDASMPIDARVHDLLSRMTMEEKIAQMARVRKTTIY